MFRGNTEQLKNAIGEMSVSSRTHRDRSISDAALSYIVELECRMNWQPIEAWNEEDYPNEVILGCWVYSEGASRWSCWTMKPFKLNGRLEFGCDGEFGDEPTHFMKIPKPPCG